MKTPQKSKLYAFTLKAGEKRTESITAQKRALISQILAVKKTKKAVIFYNQKKNISALEKHLVKSEIKTLWLDKSTTKADYEKLAQDFSQKDYAIILCPDTCIEALKTIQKEIKLAIHFDFPKNASSLHLRNNFMALGESYFLTSLEDKEIIEKLLTEEEAYIRLGRLKGHRNVAIDINFSNGKNEEKVEEKAEEKSAKAPQAAKKSQKDSEKAPNAPEENTEKKRPNKQKNKKSNEKPKSVAKEEVSEKVDTKSSKPTDAAEAAETAETSEQAKRRSRRKKDEPENNERLPAKRSRPRKSSIVTEAQKTVDETPVKERKEKTKDIKENIEPENDGGIYLDIEVKQIPMPKIRRNPQGRVIGMGEHTPNFMLKEIIFKNSTLHEEDE